VDYRYSDSGEDAHLQTFVSPVDTFSDEMLNKIFKKLSGSEGG
jgi:hypothetical protein